MASMNQSAEELLGQLVNHLMSLEHKCKSMASYFRNNYQEKYGIADFYAWCAQDLDKCVEHVTDYMKKSGTQVQLKEIERPFTEIYGEPIESLEYILKEDKCLSHLMHDIHEWANAKGDTGLKDFMHNEMIGPMSAWNEQIAEMIEKLHKANATQNLNELDKTFKSEISLIKQLREKKLI
ncbi:middle subunit-like [Brachionus plicatilis]|uniref:Ferritin n=1 Tax=Brachionus plicatilis TaxID=10195 RepID=A0A3M7P5T0_BRAPC|nr:middle subunit-like [Brachionus plicatilis]